MPERNLLPSTHPKRMHKNPIVRLLVGFLALALTSAGTLALCFGADGHLDWTTSPHAGWVSDVAVKTPGHFHGPDRPLERPHEVECVDLPVASDSPDDFAVSTNPSPVGQGDVSQLLTHQFSQLEDRIRSRLAFPTWRSPIAAGLPARQSLTVLLV